MEASKPTKESIWEKLGMSFDELTIASFALAGCLFTVALVFGIDWFLIEAPKFVLSPPYIKFAEPDWLIDN